MNALTRTRRRRADALLAASLLTLAALPAAAQDDRFANVEVVAQPVSGHVYMLTGAGGNIGASIGPDGTLIVDDQYQPLAERIATALEELGGDRPKLILNTHFHGDHTGGNPVFGATGAIVAHDNVRARLLDAEDFSPAGLPVLTFADRVQVHFNGDTIDVVHLPAGHTDGDSVVWFKQDNVLHMGDLLFHGAFPFIDLSSGGSVDGVIANLTKVLEMMPADVRIIPGHGALADLDDVRESLAMILETRASVAAALASGLSVDEVVSRGLGDEWASWGAGFINDERWIRT